MTEEEKREQILKRALPALFVTIIYFVFINDIMGEQAAKAKESYQSLAGRGIAASSLPGIRRQSAEAEKMLATAKAEQAKYVTKIKGMVGYLSGEANTTEASTQLAHILAKHQMHVSKEVSEPFHSADLPPALAEVKRLLQESIKAGKVFKVQHLWLHGRFKNMYAALAEIHQVKLAAIPIMFSLSVPKASKTGELEWELILWM